MRLVQYAAGSTPSAPPMEKMGVTPAGDFQLLNNRQHACSVREVIADGSAPPRPPQPMSHAPSCVEKRKREGLQPGSAGNGDDILVCGDAHIDVRRNALRRGALRGQPSSTIARSTKRYELRIRFIWLLLLRSVPASAGSVRGEGAGGFGRSVFRQRWRGESSPAPVKDTRGSS